MDLIGKLFAQLIFETQGTGTPAYECAVRAGYSLKAARPVASRLLTFANILARIDELNTLAASERIMNKQERMERLSEIGHGRIVDFVIDGKITVDSKSKNAGAVESVTKKRRKVGAESVMEEITEVKLHNPISAIQELNKMDQVYSQPVERPTELRQTLVVHAGQPPPTARQLLRGNRPGREAVGGYHHQGHHAV